MVAREGPGSTAGRPGIDRTPLAQRGDAARVGPYGTLPVERREHLHELVDLGQVMDHDVGMRRMLEQEVLVIGLRRVEGAERIQARHDGAREDLGPAELGDVSLGDLLL